MRAAGVARVSGARSVPTPERASGVLLAATDSTGSGSAATDSTVSGSAASGSAASGSTGAVSTDGAGAASGASVSIGGSNWGVCVFASAVACFDV